MALDPGLWHALEAHGVTEAHLMMLLRLLTIQRNGSWNWDYKNGQIVYCDARLTFPSHPHEIARVCGILFPETPVVEGFDK